MEHKKYTKARINIFSDGKCVGEQLREGPFKVQANNLIEPHEICTNWKPFKGEVERQSDNLSGSLLRLLIVFLYSILNFSDSI